MIFIQLNPKSGTHCFSNNLEQFLRKLSGVGWSSRAPVPRIMNVSSAIVCWQLLKDIINPTARHSGLVYLWRGLRTQSLPKNHPLGQESFSVIKYTGQRAPLAKHSAHSNDSILHHDDRNILRFSRIKITSAGVFIPASLAVLPCLTRKSLVKSVAIYPGVQLLTVIFGNLFEEKF